MHVLQHIDETVVALRAEHAVGRAAAQRQIDIGDTPVRVFREVAREIERERRHADAAARTRERNGLARARQRHRAHLALGHVDGALEQLDRQRLHEIVAHADLEQAAEQADVVALADRDDLHRRLAHFGQAAEVRERHHRTFEIDEQKERRALDLRQMRDRVVHVADSDVHVRHRLFEHEALQHLLGLAVRHERDEIRDAHALLALEETDLCCAHDVRL